MEAVDAGAAEGDVVIKEFVPPTGNDDFQLEVESDLIENASADSVIKHATEGVPTMRNALKFFLMLPVIIGSMFLGAILVGLSVAVDSLEMSNKAKELPSK